MNDQELKNLIIDTGLALQLKADQLRFLDLAINMAYNKGHIDAVNELGKKTELQMEGGE